MRLLYTLSAALAATELAAAAPAPQSRQTSNACGRISTGKQSRVPASLALECLRSVPNKQQPALKLLASLKSYVSWQSTLTWLKNPPKSYLFPAVDVLGQLDNIAAKVGKGGYASEYDFQLELYKLVISAHDGHFSFTGDVFRPFNFQNDLAARIISVSTDGVAIPRLYPYSAFGPGAKGDPVAITEINGVNATDFVTKQNVEFSSFQDPDSQWNSMFPSVVKPQSFLTVASSVAYQGDSVTLTFANGTKQTEQSYAALYADFSNIRNGDDFYIKFCSGKTAAGSMRLAEPATPAEEMKKRDVAGFPAPVIADPEGAISGYFLSGKGYDDVAVLLVKSFSTTGTQPVKFLNDFQKTISTFLQMCRTQGKKRLVIDLSGNGGGYVVAGYELFAQIFPELKEFGSTNVRRTESFVTIAKVIGSLPSDFSPSSMAQQNSIQTLSQSTIMTNLIPGGVERPDGTSFATIDEILEPITLHGDDFTAYQFTPLASALPGFNLTGSSGQPKPPAAVFKSENVMLLTDGTCGSTCTIFSYLMTVQASVKSTAIGGRPMTGPMQSIAGVEGAQIFLFSDIKKTANAAIGLVNDDNMQDTLRGGDLGVLAEGYALTRASDPNNAGGVNGKNNFLPRDSSTPAQFLYQPANCRFFYTAPMLGDASLVWQRAVDSSWNDPAKFCVQGSRVSVNTSANMADVGFDGADDASTVIANLGSADSKQQHQEGAAVSWRNASTSGLAMLVGVLTVLLSQL